LKLLTLALQFHPHYDGRFADKVLPNEDRRQGLAQMMQTYLSTMNDIGAETWIMHGSLLGWWWNRKIMPWDSDVDVQMSESSMEYLATYYNMTIHHYKFPGMPSGRDYMLEVNPNYVNGSTKDRLNVIDARWIDTSNGLFIDITTLRRNLTAEAEGKEGVMMCKDNHHYLSKDIFPLRDSTFEGTPVKIPYAYAELLEEEYGAKSLANKNFENYYFDSTKMEWLPNG
jgi:phosphorylcholine metabolism protein LicD